MDNQSENRNYAHLPDELLAKILDRVPTTVEKMNSMFDIQDKPIKQGIDHLRNSGKLSKLSTSEYSTSLIAVDGSFILEKMTGSDLLLAVAVGVEGLTEDTTKDWGGDKNQYYQWQTALSHDEANARLGQGVMFLMELSVLANAEHDIRIMDGAHFTSILKINSMLSANDDSVGEEYAQALRDFLQETYKKIIPDIPDIIKAAFNDDRIIALAKYSSSRDVIDAFLSKYKIKIDDKTFFSLGLNEDEYLKPLSVGQSIEEKRKIWNDLHIKCNLEIAERDELNQALAGAIKPLTTKGKESELYFTYYKPYQDGPAYRIELKKSLAQDTGRLEKYLLSIKRQIVFPEIREPYPQYLADLMAKSISTGMFAIEEAIKLSPALKIDKGKFNLLFNYRTKL
ncbi:DNA double-strand break repair nuclease NurA [Candidatus Parcubacteria bacterium]|nr:DNA double-strand break repair nuclease NurA [Patescibacteria group bacterium]MCG2688196.1 DNA double-strand break repair nuclease NurA [Candidatus Parcubacteria bacterium]MCG2697641.1 DNA double-strand break repair nuclease NurA [Candidatus Parcubacteria bacterium]